MRNWLQRFDDTCARWKDQLLGTSLTLELPPALQEKFGGTLLALSGSFADARWILRIVAVRSSALPPVVGGVPLGDRVSIENPGKAIVMSTTELWGLIDNHFTLRPLAIPYKPYAGETHETLCGQRGRLETFARIARACGAQPPVRQPA